MISLRPEDVQIHPLASTKHLFYYKGDLYSNAKLPMPMEVLKELPIQSLEPTEFKLNDRDVYKLKEHYHRLRIQEASPIILKRILTKVCDINMVSSQHGKYTADLHEANIVYTQDGVLWLDLDAFRPDHSKAALCFMYLIEKYVRKSFRGSRNEFRASNMSQETKNMFGWGFQKKESWAKLKKYVQGLNIQYSGSHWADDYSNNMDIENPHKVNTKAGIVCDLIDELDFNSVTDIACNKGYYSMYCTIKAESVIGVDLEPSCIEAAVPFAEKNGYNKVIFGVKNIADLHRNKLYEKERYSSDLVLALAIVHHIRKVITPENFAKTLTSISKKYVLIEDIGSGPEYEKEFTKCGFKLHKRVNSHPGNRMISVYKKI